jgi:hypothetical protein
MCWLLRVILYREDPTKLVHHFAYRGSSHLHKGAVTVDIKLYPVVSPSFAIRDVFIRTPKAAGASRHATSLASLLLTLT